MSDGRDEMQRLANEALEAALTNSDKAEITRLTAENQRLKSEALFTAISVLPEKDAEIETLTARVKELEKRLATAVADMDRMGFSPIWLEPSRAALSQPTTQDTA
jgi:hypothetical protein